MDWPLLTDSADTPSNLRTEQLEGRATVLNITIFAHSNWKRRISYRAPPFTSHSPGHKYLHSAERNIPGSLRNSLDANVETTKPIVQINTTHSHSIDWILFYQMVARAVCRIDRISYWTVTFDRLNLFLSDCCPICLSNWQNSLSN